METKRTECGVFSLWAGCREATHLLLLQLLRAAADVHRR